MAETTPNTLHYTRTLITLHVPKQAIAALVPRKPVHACQTRARQVNAVSCWPTPFVPPRHDVTLALVLSDCEPASRLQMPALSFVQLTVQLRIC
jgi:hypothetical protein